jgi:hypothetical protein
MHSRLLIIGVRIQLCISFFGLPTTLFGEKIVIKYSFLSTTNDLNFEAYM